LLKRNPVQKSYARPLFPVNEKCNLITQVWQNLALNRWPGPQIRYFWAGGQGFAIAGATAPL
jgi:hypothetical protein